MRLSIYYLSLCKALFSRERALGVFHTEALRFSLKKKDLCLKYYCFYYHDVNLSMKRSMQTVWFVWCPNSTWRPTVALCCSSHIPVIHSMIGNSVAGHVWRCSSIMYRAASKPEHCWSCNCLYVGTTGPTKTTKHEWKDTPVRLNRFFSRSLRNRRQLSALFVLVRVVRYKCAKFTIKTFSMPVDVLCVCRCMYVWCCGARYWSEFSGCQ